MDGWTVDRYRWMDRWIERGRQAGRQREMRERERERICDDLEAGSQGIARRFADEFLSGKTRTVILKSLGKEWEVRYVVSGERRRKFGTGWGRFADDNELHLGDALVFQLTNQRNAVSCLDVRIFRFHEKLPLPSL